MTGSKRTTFRGAKRRCKSEWDALPWLRWRRSRRKGQVWAEPKNSFLQNCINTCPSFLNGRKKRSGISLWKSTGKSEESRQRVQDLNVLTCVRQLAPIASQARHFPPSSGEADAKEERIHSFIILNTLFAINLCRILRWESHYVFPLSSFRFCSPLKNDGRGVLFCHNVLTCVCGNVNEFFYQTDVICIIYFLICNKKAYLAGTSFLLFF